MYRITPDSTEASAGQVLRTSLKALFKIRDHDPTHAHQCALEWMAEARRHGDVALIAEGQLLLSRCALSLGRSDEWLELAGHAVQLAEGVGEPALLCTALSDFAYASAFMGSPLEALPLFERALTLATDAPDAEVLASLKMRTADALALMGRVHESIAMRRNALAWLKDKNARCACHLSLIALLCCDLPSPAEADVEMRRFDQELQGAVLPPQTQATYLCIATAVHALNGRVTEMLSLEGRASLVAPASWHFYGWMLRLVANALMNVGDLEAAQRRVTDFLTLDLTLSKFEQVRWLRCRARLLKLQGQVEPSEALDTQASALSEGHATDGGHAEITILNAKLQLLEARLHLARSQDEARQLRDEILSREAALRRKDAAPQSLLTELLFLHARKRSPSGVMELGELGFHLVYQPVLDLSRLQLTGCEALLRLEHPQVGSMFPGEFLHRLERWNDIIEVGQWVALQSCRQLSLWKQAGAFELGVTINVAVSQLAGHGFASTLAAETVRHGLAASSIELEVTEAGALRERGRELVTQELMTLKHMGYGLCIDAVGADPSHLDWLYELGVRKLKLDRLLVRQVEHELGKLQATEILVANCRQRGLAVVAAGVETAAQAGALRSLGCTHLQGFWICRPLDPTAVGAALQRSPNDWLCNLVDASRVC